MNVSVFENVLQALTILGPESLIVSQSTDFTIFVLPRGLSDTRMTLSTEWVRFPKAYQISQKFFLQNNLHKHLIGDFKYQHR